MHTTVMTGEITTSTTNMAPRNQTRTHLLPHRKPKVTARGPISLGGASQIRSDKDHRSQGEGMLLQRLGSWSLY